MWKNGNFLKDSKYHFWKILCFQKSPQIPVFLSVFNGKGPFCKIFQKLRGLSGKCLFFSLPLFFFLRPEGRPRVDGSPAPRPGRLREDKEDPDALLHLLSLPYPLAPFLSLSLSPGTPETSPPP